MANVSVTTVICQYYNKEYREGLPRECLLTAAVSSFRVRQIRHTFSLGFRGKCECHNVTFSIQFLIVQHHVYNITV